MYIYLVAVKMTIWSYNITYNWLKKIQVFFIKTATNNPTFPICLTSNHA